MSDFRYSSLHRAGWQQVSDPDGITTEADTARCVHCGKHWVINPDSLKGRAFCTNCNGFVCGPKCEVCVPFEKWLDCYEKGKDPKTIVTVRGGWGSR